MLRRYDLKSVKGEGWAIIVIDTDIGFFSTVSDWGNYAYLWSSPGCEFRKFLIGLDVDYLRSKLLHGRSEKLRVFDGEATKEAIKEATKNNKGKTWGHYRHELEVLEDHDLDNEVDFGAWQSETRLEEPWTFGVWKPDPQCTGFCEKVYPRFKELLEAELEQEKKDEADVEAIKMAKPAILAAARAELDAARRDLEEAGLIARKEKT